MAGLPGAVMCKKEGLPTAFLRVGPARGFSGPVWPCLRLARGAVAGLLLLSASPRLSLEAWPLAPSQVTAKENRLGNDWKLGRGHSRRRLWGTVGHFPNSPREGAIISAQFRGRYRVGLFWSL